MQRDELIRQLMGTFLDELEEHVQAMNRDLLALERDPAGADKDEHLRVFFRTVHSLKGASRAVNLAPVESACHRMEELLELAQEAPLAPPWFQVLFAAADALRDAGARLRRGESLDASPLVELLPRLEEATLLGVEAVAVRAPPRMAPTPTVPPPVTPVAPAAPAHAAPAHAAPAHAAPAHAAPAHAADEDTSSAAAPAQAAPGPRRSEHGTVRVPAEKLDALLVRVGELVLSSGRSEQVLDQLELLQDQCQKWLKLELDRKQRDPALRRAHELVRDVGRKLEQIFKHAATGQRSLEQAVRATEDDVHRLRLLPFGNACLGLERMVRDLAQETGKQIELSIDGTDVGMDRGVLEALRDPLLHLVRNAVEHGVESPESRRAAGKPPGARVRVAASLRGAQVEVVVSDDGRGIDLDAIRAQARRRGLPVPGDERDLAQVIFQPGFSTARMITKISGRGVGLDVVKSQVEAHHGQLQLDWQPGRGTSFVVTVPLTVTTIHALLVAVAGQLYAVPISAILALRRLTVGELRSVEGRQTVVFDGQPLAVVQLANALGLRDTAISPPEGKMPGLVLTAQGKRVVVLVDELVGAQDIVVKDLGERMRHLRHMSGATLLASGRIALVLHTPELVRTVLARAPQAAVIQAKKQERRRILIADDSLTTRTLVKTILEAAGYSVRVATDGAEAWRMLNDEAADLVVSDVEMPRMDGFTLAATIRGSRRFHDLPVVLVTSLDKPEHKQKGLDSGADAYLVKSAFDQSSLLDIIRQLT